MKTVQVPETNAENLEFWIKQADDIALLQKEEYEKQGYINTSTNQAFQQALFNIGHYYFQCLQEEKVKK